MLLGFSYGGMVVTGAVSHVADRVRHLVYLDAFLPEDGQSLNDLTDQPGDPVLELGEQWLIPARPREYEDPAEAAFADLRRTPHPRGCFTEQVRLPRQLEDYPFGRTYIKATVEEYPKAFWNAADRARSSPSWNYREIATNHMVPMNRPQELTEMLLELA